MLRTFVRNTGLLLSVSLSLTGLTLSACGKSNADVAPAAHAYSVSVQPMDTGSLTIDGCPVTLSMVTLHPNDRRADYVNDESDRVYVAHCPTTVTTSAVQTCGKNCQISDVIVKPLPAPADAVLPTVASVPSSDVLSDKLAKQLQALSPPEIEQVLNRLSPNQRVALGAEALRKAIPEPNTHAASTGR